MKCSGGTPTAAPPSTGVKRAADHSAPGAKVGKKAKKAKKGSLEEVELGGMRLLKMTERTRATCHAALARPRPQNKRPTEHLGS